MRKTPAIDTYDPILYPRKLWVTNEIEGLDKIFQFNKMSNPNEEDLEGYNDLSNELEEGTGVLVGCPVVKKSTREYGLLLIILRIDYIEAGDEAHEAVHFADYLFEQLGMYTQTFTEHNEQYAYLVGWAAGCISKSIIKYKKDDDRRE